MITLKRIKGQYVVTIKKIESVFDTLFDSLVFIGGNGNVEKI